MLIHVLRQPLCEIQTPWLVLPLFEDQADLPAGVQDTPLGNLLRALISQKELTGSLAELTPVHGPAGFAAGSVLVVGLGPRGKFDSGAAFAAGFALAKRLAGKPRETIAVAFPSGADPSAAGWISATVEGIVAGTRGPGLRKTEPNRHPFGTLNLLVGPEQPEDSAHRFEQQVRRGEIVGQAINLARDLANTPPSEKCPVRLAEQIRTMAIRRGAGRPDLG